jgi:hypothetical protein
LRYEGLLALLAGYLSFLTPNSLYLVVIYTVV